MVAATSTYRIDAIALISRFFGSSLGEATQLLVSFGILGLAALTLWSFGRTKRSADTRVWANIICVTLLLSVYHQT